MGWGGVVQMRSMQRVRRVGSSRVAEGRRPSRGDARRSRSSPSLRDRDQRRARPRDHGAQAACSSRFVGRKPAIAPFCPDSVALAPPNPVADNALSTRPQVTSFLSSHPGGDDLIYAHAGKDITTMMADPLEHAHSGPAYEMLAEFQVGVIGAEEAIVNPDFVFTDHFQPEDTETAEDYRKNRFLDLERPLIMQVWNSNFSKGFYLQQCVFRL